MADAPVVAAPDPGEVAYLVGRLPLVSSAGAVRRAAELLTWQHAEIERLNGLVQTYVFTNGRDLNF